MKKQFVKTCAIFMACLSLSLSMFISYSVPTQAAAVSISLPRCIDIILTKQGVVANQTSLSSIGDVLIDTLDTSMKGYITYCRENGLDWKEKESYTLWKENTNIVNALLDAIVKNRQKNEDDSPLNDTDVVNVLVDPNGGTNNVIPKSIQQPIVDAYKAWWEDCGGYYLYYIPSYKELTSFYKNTTEYDNLEYLTSKHDFVYLICAGANYSNSYNHKFTFFDLDSMDCFIMKEKGSDGYCNILLYDDWVKVSTYYPTTIIHEDLSSPYMYLTGFPLDDSCSYGKNNNGYYAIQINYFEDNGYVISTLVSNTGKYLKVWKSLDAFKAYSVGVQNVYYSPNHSTTVSNDITVTTDYITTYANQYSYSTVQQQIDNSSEITEETVNSIVGSTITNITNNYYYTSPSDDTNGGGSVSGGDSDDKLNGGDYDGLFDGLLGNLLSLITNLIEFIVKFFVKGLELITVGFNAILEMLNTLTDSIGGIGEMIAAFFPFVPQEFFTLVMGTISVLCGLAIYKALRG